MPRTHDTPQVKLNDARHSGARRKTHNAAADSAGCICSSSSSPPARCTQTSLLPCIPPPRPSACSPSSPLPSASPKVESKKCRPPHSALLIFQTLPVCLSVCLLLAHTHTHTPTCQNFLSDYTTPPSSAPPSCCGNLHTFT